MRLSEILSKPIAGDFKQVDGFLNNSALKCGKQKKISVGKVGLNFYCANCGDVRTFNSNDELFCIGVHERSVSIDCVLKCPICEASIPLWFLLESEKEIHAHAPEIRILKRSAKFSEMVRPEQYTYGDFSTLLDKAERAYREELGAGAIVYLRKIYESITVQSALAVGIEINKPSGKQRPFRQLLEDVDEQCHIIPAEFAANGYQLFGELSDVVHGEYDEELGLKKYDALRRLVVGVLDNVKNNREIVEATNSLGWNVDETEVSI